MSNKSAAYAFRSEVLLALHAAGWHSAYKPSEGSGDPTSLRGKILGLPVTLASRNELTYDLSGALREVQQEAVSDGNDVYASIHSRRGHPIESSYVVTDLATWLRILARLSPPV